MNHHSSVFANSCVRRPVDPISKMPETDYERKEKNITEQLSIDSTTTSVSMSAADVDAEKLKDFYRSIPDYNDINHLPPEEFYSTLKFLREKKKVMLGLAVDHIDDSNGIGNRPTSVSDKNVKSKNLKSRKYSIEREHLNDRGKTPATLNLSSSSTSLKRSSRKLVVNDSIDKKSNSDMKLAPVKNTVMKDTSLSKNERQKRNHSACSITWNDTNIEAKTEVDKKFDRFFEEKRYSSPISKIDLTDEIGTQSMPSSPLRTKSFGSPSRKIKNITIPKPFKMTERDEEQRIVTELRSLRKSFSEDMLHQKCERKQFKAKPVPIESRIPLYDKILEDQAMRRAITKINSEAELRAQMKPFSFTKREEKGISGVCERAAHILQTPKKKKRFKARPVPKNLFSNYFYNKMKENEFFRSMNKRIRAEEMLRSANLPGNMTIRDRSRLSTPAAHSDLPIDPSPIAPSISSLEKQRSKSPIKERKKRDKSTKEQFITTSPVPFRFNTANRAAKKMEEVTKKIYQESKSTASVDESGTGGGLRAYSAIELRAAASGRSNLAALLRAEAVRRRFEIEANRRLVEQRRRVEMKQRDRLLRNNPAWHLVKNNHEEDIAMRLQTRRDEERMRREEFLHEMELMYGRVQQQPLLFERYYAPRLNSAPVDSIQLSPRRTTGKKRSSRKNKSYHFNTPNRYCKVCINDIPEKYNGDVVDYINRENNDDKLYSDSEVALDSIDGGKL